MMVKVLSNVSRLGTLPGIKTPIDSSERKLSVQLPSCTKSIKTVSIGRSQAINFNSISCRSASKRRVLCRFRQNGCAELDNFASCDGSLAAVFLPSVLPAVQEQLFRGTARQNHLFCCQFPRVAARFLAWLAAAPCANQSQFRTVRFVDFSQKVGLPSVQLRLGAELLPELSGC